MYTGNLLQYILYIHTHLCIEHYLKSQGHGIWLLCVLRFLNTSHVLSQIHTGKRGVDLAKQSYNGEDYSYLQCTSVKGAGRKTGVGAANRSEYD